MNVNLNLAINAVSKKQDIPNSANKKEEFKKVLDNHELNAKNSSNKSADEEIQKTKENEYNNDADRNIAKNSDAKDLNNVESENPVKAKLIDLIKISIDALKENTKKPSKELGVAKDSTDEMAEIQQLLQLLSSMLQNLDEATTTTTTTKNGEISLDTINLEQFIDNAKLAPNAKNIMKNQLSEIVALLEKTKGNSPMSSEISEMLQKLTTEANEVKGNVNLFKAPSVLTIKEDSQLKNTIVETSKITTEILPENQMQSSSSSSKDKKFPGNSSSEEKFLNNLLGEDKDEKKISKAVNFMNQFETVKNTDTSKVQSSNLVIDKNNFEVDVIKNIKFMEANNIKDLTVKMNPKELGEITIKLTMESGIMKANISAQNKDTYNLLNQHFQDISDKLKNMDIKIQSLDINIYEDSTFFSKDSNERNNQGRQNSNRGTSTLLEDEDISISNNYAVEDNQVNKFV